MGGTVWLLISDEVVNLCIAKAPAESRVGAFNPVALLARGYGVLFEFKAVFFRLLRPILKRLKRYS